MKLKIFKSFSIKFQTKLSFSNFFNRTFLEFSLFQSLNRHNWIRETFTRRECSRFIASSRDFDKCGCGRTRDAHRNIPELTSEFLRQKRSVAALEQQRSVSTTNNDDMHFGNLYTVGWIFIFYFSKFQFWKK